MPNEVKWDNFVKNGHMGSPDTYSICQAGLHAIYKLKQRKKKARIVDSTLDW